MNPPRPLPTPHSRSRRLLVGVLLLVTLVLPGCADRKPLDPVADPQLQAYVDLVMPEKVEIQRFLTKPVSFAGDGAADGLEAILAVYDATGDLTKMAGTCHFALETRKPSETIGAQVGFWRIELTSADAMREYRDNLSRYYGFPLLLPHKPLPAGNYVLSVWLHLPAGRRLYDEYQFTYDGTGAPPRGL